MGPVLSSSRVLLPYTTFIKPLVIDYDGYDCDAHHKKNSNDDIEKKIWHLMMFIFFAWLCYFNTFLLKILTMFKVVFNTFGNIQQCLLMLDYFDVFNRPGIAGSVLPSHRHWLIDWFSRSWFFKISFKHWQSQTGRARKLKFWENVSTTLCVMCHLSHVTCHLSGVMCQKNLKHFL